MFFHEIENSKEESVSKIDKKYGKLTGALCELIENYSQVAFNLVDNTDRMSLTHALMKID